MKHLFTIICSNSATSKNGNETELFGDRDPANWRKINEIIVYQQFEREYKRNPELAKKLVNFFIETPQPEFSFTENLNIRILVSKIVLFRHSTQSEKIRI